MESRRSTTIMLAVIFCLSWMVGFATPTSENGIARNNSRTNDQGLRSAISKMSSLGESDNVMLNELKDIVLFLSQKIDDSDERIQLLEDQIGAQELTIKTLQNEVNDASSFHRYLQTDDGDCLPRYQNTSFGPRCDFSYVTRFQDRVFFNDDVVFNENVEFDSDANCMPTYNSTTQMCRMNNNFTFDEGDITFEYNVDFDDDVRFNDGVRFRDTVRLESDVEFNDGGEVTFRKATKFEEDVLVKNADHDIEFKLEGKVSSKFYHDGSFKVDTGATFYDHVTLEDDLDVDGKLSVKKMTKLDDLELYGYLWVDGETRLEGKLTANHHANIKNGLTVETGGLDVSQGATISGTTRVTGTLDGNSINANSITTTKATINGQKYSSKIDIEEVVTGLEKVTTPVMIPKLRSLNLKVEESTKNGQIVPATFNVGGRKIQSQIDQLKTRIDNLP